MTDTVRLPNAASENGRESRPVLLLRNVREGDKADTQRFELDKFRLLIGRADTADIRLDEGHGASRHHAQVFVIDGEVVIEDMSSRNGTYVNRKLIRGERQTTLNYGDVITIGKYRLKLVDEAHPEDQEPDPVFELMRLWHGAAVRSLQFTCILDDLSDAAPVETTEPDATTATEASPDESADIDDTQPMPMIERAAIARHGIQFERDLPRRARKLVKRESSKRIAPMAQVARSRRLARASRLR